MSSFLEILVPENLRYNIHKTSHSFRCFLSQIVSFLWIRPFCHILNKWVFSMQMIFKISWWLRGFFFGFKPENFRVWKFRARKDWLGLRRGAPSKKHWLGLRRKNCIENVMKLILKFPPSVPAGQKKQIKYDGIVIKIPAERPCGAKHPKKKKWKCYQNRATPRCKKFKEKVMKLLSEFPPSGPAGQKNEEKWRNCYQNSRRAALRGKKSKEKVMKLLSEFLPSDPAGQKITRNPSWKHSPWLDAHCDVWRWARIWLRKTRWTCRRWNFCTTKRHEQRLIP